MPAAALNSALPEKIAVLAGGGALPLRLLEACDRKKIETFLVGFDGQTDPALTQGRAHLWSRLGAAGHIIKTLKAHGIRDIIFIGSITRPGFAELRPDRKTAEFFARYSWKLIGGDNGIAGALREFLAAEGFRILGIQSIADDLTAPEGLIGAIGPDKKDWLDIEKGVVISQAMGALDIGQSVIVQEGIVLAVEAAEGTDRLIERAKPLIKGGRGGVLVKTCKPGQDTDFDLPTMGPQTVQRAAEAGLGGIAIHAGASLIVDPEQVAQIADRHKIFVMGIRIPESSKDTA